MNSQLVRRVLLAVAIIVALAAAIPGFRYYRYIESHVSTDDAYVDGTVALVSSRVAGTVTNVYVEDNWTVKEGQLLLTLDPRDFDVRVEQAQAQLERARQSVDELYALVDAARSGVSLTVSQLKQAKIDVYKRQCSNWVWSMRISTPATLRSSICPERPRPIANAGISIWEQWTTQCWSRRRSSEPATDREQSSYSCSTNRMSPRRSRLPALTNAEPCIWRSST